MERIKITTIQEVQSTNHHWASIGKLGGRSGKTRGVNDGVGPGKGQARVEEALQNLMVLSEKVGAGAMALPVNTQPVVLEKHMVLLPQSPLHGGSSGGAGQWMGSGWRWCNILGSPRRW